MNNVNNLLELKNIYIFFLWGYTPLLKTAGL